MTKRVVLWLVGLVAFGFTYIAAVNLKEVSVGYLGYVDVSCKGMWNPSAWFDQSCSDSLPPRLGALALGLVALLVCGYFAEKGQPRGPAAPRSVSRPTPRGKQGPFPPLVGGHDVRSDGDAFRFKCKEPGCEFAVTGVGARLDARKHRMETGATFASPSEPSSLVNAYGFDTASLVVDGSAQDGTVSTQAAIVDEAATPQFKVCPDCAEEVRSAARKCRFCGYEFESSRNIAEPGEQR